MYFHTTVIALAALSATVIAAPPYDAMTTFAGAPTTMITSARPPMASGAGRAAASGGFAGHRNGTATYNMPSVTAKGRDPMETGKGPWWYQEGQDGKDGMDGKQFDEGKEGKDGMSGWWSTATN